MDSFTVIVAIDESDHSKNALDFYLENLHQKHHSVILAHTVEVPQMLEWGQPGIIKEFLNEAEKEAEELEESFQERLRKNGVESKVIKPEISTNAGEFIISAAEKEDASLIVMGSRGLGTIRRTILGSVSDYVLHHASCPVFIRG